jgi:hypothetical protein
MRAALSLISVSYLFTFAFCLFTFAFPVGLAFLPFAFPSRFAF